ncbi:G-type lectin S-receptor-like serine/threonine-protein kinase LECRK1 [Gossypium australe]|uniref:non-specific serine/threonine protein kinase n=1 Tax=Gossypium australe TaxID=47621 RepID=A0A5B6V5X3_9ROSI|nr:G-type lectin S-receptor-like serine/threonine-protein kinase LECRK1 [Gossypium australe]
MMTLGVSHKSSSIISLGSSLSSATQSILWHSPPSSFAFGFYSQGGGLSVGVWLDGGGKNDNKVVWTANRDDPPVTSNGTLILNEKGVLLSIAVSGEKNVIASPNNSAISVFSASMLYSSNFVLYNKDNHTIWKSFEQPTDTLLGGQTLLTDHKLISSSSEKDHSPGRFHLKLTYNYYNESSSSNNNSTVFSASLDVDGNFRLYAYLFERNGVFQTYQLLRALLNSCKVRGFCGLNSYCTFNDNRPYCACLTGTDFIDPLQNNLGCKRNYFEAHCKGGKANIPFYNMASMPCIEWTTGSFYDCNYEAAQFKNGICRKQKLPLRYLLRDPDAQVNSTVLLKVGIISLEADNGTVPSELRPSKVLIKQKNTTVLIFLLTFSLVACSCALLTISGVYIYKFRVLRYKRLLELGNLGLTEELTLTLFSYKELKRATNGFKEELGKGSFGAVYKGSLDRGRQLIAVKRLEKLVEEGEKEFQAEMRAIGRAHHKNLVRLLGYCVEDSKRLLVYEFMGNGSLADLLFKSTNPPDWDERTRIALDVVRGILYLHDECETPIIHCDIKPQNILMDDLWRVKISDFGLAKLLMGDETRTFTRVRGTRGYMAPEWHKSTPISVKVDIYSYGVVLCLVEKELDKLMLGEEVDKRSLERMVMVALWCIQDEPALRPSIKTVLMMLEGITDICIPPRPTASFI